MRIKRNPNNANGQPFQPYFFIIADDGTAQYRIDKTEPGKAADAMFTIYRCADGRIAKPHITKITPHGVRGLAKVRDVARWLCAGMRIRFDVYTAHNQPCEVHEYDPATDQVVVLGLRPSGRPPLLYRVWARS